MNSIRQDILLELGTQLSLIKIANGYHNDIPIVNIYKGYKSLNQINTYPTIFFGLGAEKLESASEDDVIIKSELEAYIGVWFQSDDITEETEQWVRDIKRFVQMDSTINKVLDLSGIEGVQRYNISNILPYMDYDKNIGSLLIEFTIEFVQSTTVGL